MWRKSLNSLKEVTENLRRQNRENVEEASSQMKPSNVGPEWETQGVREAAAARSQKIQ